MSFDIGAVVRAELARPEVRAEVVALEQAGVAGILLLEKIGVKVLEAALESAVPLLRLVEPLMDRLGGALENLTEEEARKLFPVSAQATIGTHTLALTVAKVFPPDLPQGPEETVADWPTERNKD